MLGEHLLVNGQVAGFIVAPRSRRGIRRRSPSRARSVEVSLGGELAQNLGRVALDVLGQREHTAGLGERDGTQLARPLVDVLEDEAVELLEVGQVVGALQAVRGGKKGPNTTANAGDKSGSDGTSSQRLPPGWEEIEVWTEPPSPSPRPVRPPADWLSRYAEPMTTKEKLRAQLEELSEQEAEHAQIIVGHPEPDVAGLPDGWGETLTGEPMPNVVAAVRRVRDKH